MFADWRAALNHLEKQQQKHLDLQIEIAEIPATYFKEKARAEYMALKFQELGLEVNIDSAGNVRAFREGDNANDNLIIIAAHLDVAFPASTNFKVKRKGDRFLGPSIVDNSRGLVTMYALAEALNEANIKTQNNLLFLSSVGEEGLGDLRGVKALFADEKIKRSTKSFIALDSHGHENIVHKSLGSKRYRVVISGDGGHSYLDFGNLNPLSAVAEIISRIDQIKVSEGPRTTFNVGVLSAGSSVNVIPRTASFEMDLRSEDIACLEALERSFILAVEDGVEAVNQRCANPESRLDYKITVIGDRPCGATSENDLLVKSAIQAAEELGLNSFLESGSCDANVPMNLGIPAIMLGAGGQGGGLHSDKEWFDPVDAHLGPQRALLSTLLFDAA